MKQPEIFPPESITAQMTLLDVLYRWRASEAVFAAYETQAGVCLRCQALFDSLETAAARYGLDLAVLLHDLNALVRSLPPASR